MRRIQEKETERGSFEQQISHVDLSHIDEREKSMVRSFCSGFLSLFFSAFFPCALNYADWKRVCVCVPGVCVSITCELKGKWLQ